MNTIKNLLKESAQQMGLMEALSVETVCFAMFVALICAVIIYLVYRYFYKGVSYSENFGTLLIMLTMVTAFIIICISSNLVLSLGMVGALSIVRFRAAVKEPLDVGFLFLAIASGMTAGARLYMVAVLGTVLVSLVFVASQYITGGKQSYLLVIQYNDEAKKSIEHALYHVKKSFKSKIKHDDVTELTYMVRFTSKDSNLVDKLYAIKGVENVVLVQYTQEA